MELQMCTPHLKNRYPIHFSLLESIQLASHLLATIVDDLFGIIELHHTKLGEWYVDTDVGRRNLHGHLGVGDHSNLRNSYSHLEIVVGRRPRGVVGGTHVDGNKDVVGMTLHTIQRKCVVYASINIYVMTLDYGFKKTRDRDGRADGLRQHAFVKNFLASV